MALLSKKLHKGKKESDQLSITLLNATGARLIHQRLLRERAEIDHRYQVGSRNDRSILLYCSLNNIV